MNKLTDDDIRAMFRAMHMLGSSTRNFANTKRTEGKWKVEE
tara:strand:+ start:4280 stop:4402 length:123 start_codon:yes stop_codon:yes gene_type:complete